MQVFSTQFYDYIAQMTDMCKIRDLLILAIFKPGKAISFSCCTTVLCQITVQNVSRFQDFSKKIF